MTFKQTQQNNQNSGNPAQMIQFQKEIQDKIRGQ
jgi:hypothetical protein